MGNQNVVLITGATRGIGAGFVEHYLSNGWIVVGAARNVDSFDVAYDRFVPVALDVADEESIQRMTKQIEGMDLKLDLIINNAGISLDENFGEWSTGHYMKHFLVNSVGPMLISQSLSSALNDGAKIINLSSGMGSLEINIAPEGGLDAYAASKAALNMLSLRLAEKLKERSVTVVAMSPGWVRTDTGGPDATSSVSDAVASMASAIEGLALEQSGAFMDETGKVLPW